MSEKKKETKKEEKNNSTENTGIERKTEKLKKKTSTKKKVLIGIVIFVAVLVLLLGGIILAADIYLDSMIGLVSVDDGNQSWVEGAPESDDISFEQDFSHEAPPADAEIPEIEITDLFDGETVKTEYDDKVLNVLLIGADTLDGNSARSDTMILLSVNPLKNRIVFTSFMRDSYVSIPGYGYNRLNASHSKGGPSLLIETIEYNFGIDIDYYAKVDFTSFRQAVDAIGGIDLTINSVNYNYFKTWSVCRGLTEEEATDGTRVVHLDGSQALAYARNRKYFDGDFTRTQHQRDFLTQFVQSCKGASLDELHSLLETILPYVVTSMPHDQIKTLVWDAVLTYLTYDITDARVPCAGSHSNLTLDSGAQVLNINVGDNAKYLKAKIYG